MCRFLRFFLVLLIIGATPLMGALAAPVALVVPEKKPLTSYIMPTAEQLGQQLQTLVTGEVPPQADGAEGDDALPEPAPTFGMRALSLIITALDLVETQGRAYLINLAALPQLSVWYDQQLNNPKLRAMWDEVGNGLSPVAIALAIFLLLEFLVYPWRRNLRLRKPTTTSGKATVVLSLFFLRAITIAVFAATSVILLNQGGYNKLPRFIVLNLVYALSMMRVVMSVIRGLLAPKSGTLRILPMSMEQARYAWRWLSAYCPILIISYFMFEVAQALRVPEDSMVAVGNVIGLILVAMTVVVIVQKRALGAVLLRGNLSAAAPDLGLIDGLRLWLARSWHVLAILYLVIGYSIAAMGVQNGILMMVRGTVGTLVMLVGLYAVQLPLQRWAERDSARGGGLHHVILRLFLRFVMWGAAILGILWAWGVDVSALLDTPLGQRLMGSSFSVGLTIIILSLVYEMTSSRIDRHINRKADDAGNYHASARVRTLLPMVRNTLFACVLAAIILVILSEAGVNIGPLLAGAGILGVAFGFGSQSLVKDFLTGLFIILENAVAIGDVIKVGEFAGKVEALNIRTLRLRDLDGSVHVLPFSEVGKITNLTKDFSFAVISVGVAYDTDLDRAMEIIREVGDRLKNDQVVGIFVLEPTEVLGVDSLGDYAITLMARIKTIAGKQHDVRRRFLLLLKQEFDRQGIKIPFPTIVQLKDN